jgi:hypothetical protein
MTMLAASLGIILTIMMIVFTRPGQYGIDPNPRGPNLNLNPRGPNLKPLPPHNETDDLEMYVLHHRSLYRMGSSSNNKETRGLEYLLIQATRLGGFETPIPIFYDKTELIECTNSKTARIGFSRPIRATIPCRVYAIPYYTDLECAQRAPIDFAFKHLRTIPKAVWRGSPTGLGTNFKTKTKPRIEFVKSMMNISWIDAGFTQGPNNLAGMMRPHIPFNDFGRYRAVIDIDGNAWSSRFGPLLCLGTVVVKMDPTTSVNYFWDELTPWIHYIPANMSNVATRSAYAINPANDPAINKIIGAATAWCTHKYNINQLVSDTHQIIMKHAAATLWQVPPRFKRFKIQDS